MSQSIDQQSFRNALGAFATGVTIITAIDADGADVGMTANSFNSVSLSPPMVLWSLGHSSTNFAAFLQAKHFAVHVLATDQDALAMRFAQKGIDRFAGLTVSHGAGGVPLIEGAAARFECRCAHQYDGGDHVIFVGEVLAFDHWEREPLVYKRGRFSLAVGMPTASDLAPGLAPTDDELEKLITALSERLVEQDMQRLQQLTLVSDSRLSSLGRRTLLELLSVAQASCATSLDEAEQIQFRQLLKKVLT